MKTLISKIAMLGTVMHLTACTTTDQVIFVTKSSLSIADIETTPAEVTVGYDRVEGYFAPAYSNGALPPVVSSIRTDGGLLAPEIQQLYATGQAANLVVEHSLEYDPNDEPELTGEKKGMFFGTSTNLGFKIGVTQNKPSINIGYKRIEASYIPLGTEDGVDIYPSVIASIDTTIKTPTPGDENSEGIQVGQYFATGSVAKSLATKDYIRDGFAGRAKDSIDNYKEQLGQQQDSALHTLKCAASLNDTQWPYVINAADSASLLGNVGSELNTRWQSFLNDKTIENRQKATKLYYSAISNLLDGSSPTYAAVLKAHRNLVCNLAREANNG